MKLRKNSVPRVLRGGGYFNDTGDMHVTLRDGYGPESRSTYDGFRFVIRGKK